MWIAQDVDVHAVGFGAVCASRVPPTDVIPAPRAPVRALAGPGRDPCTSTPTPTSIMHAAPPPRPRRSYCPLKEQETKCMGPGLDPQGRCRALAAPDGGRGAQFSRILAARSKIC